MPISQMSSMDRPIDPAVTRRRKVKLLIRIGTVVVILVVGFFILSAWISPSLRRSEIRTAVVDSGLVEATINATGTVIPEFEEVISSPSETRVLRVLKHPGEKLQPGDQFLVLDASEDNLALERASNDLVLKGNAASELRLEQQHTLADLESQLHIKELNLSYLRSKGVQQKRLFDIGAISKDQLDQAKLQEEIADTEKQSIVQSIENSRSTLENKLRGLETEIATLQKEKADVEHRLGILACRASRAGVLTAVVEDIGATIHRGDVIARIADLNTYHVDAEASDIHAAEISVGMPAHVIANGLELQGSVAHINPSINNGIMKFSVALREKSQSSLRANLRVDVAVVTAMKGRALRVASGPFVNGSGPQDVFVVHGNRADRVSARIGVSGYDYVEVLDGLTRGDEVIISDMRDYLHVKEIRLK